MVSGVSGSGKSSLAFDTIYAEGQRRYVESLSAYARQFLERIEKPDVDLIDGLAPAIAIKQKNSTRNPRSTVATATEVYDYLRLLYARCGTVHCVHCDGLVKRDSMDEVAEATSGAGRGNAPQCALSGAPRRARAGGRSQARSPRSEIRQIRRQAGSRIPADRSPQGAPRRAARLRLQPPLPAGQHLRVLHARVAARPGLHAAGLCPSGPHRRQRGEPRPHRRRRRDRLPRGRRGDLRGTSARRSRRPRRAIASPPPTSARAAIGRAASRSRASSASTIPSAHVPAARASATPWTST